MSNTPTRYDLITVNNVDCPDVKKGTLTMNPVPKYKEHETEGGGKVIDEIAENMWQGTVSYNGLFQSEIQTIKACLKTVSTMTIYDPLNGQTISFIALIVPQEMEKKEHTGQGNVWSFGFTFEKIGDITNGN